MPHTHNSFNVTTQLYKKRGYSIVRKQQQQQHLKNVHTIWTGSHRSCPSTHSVHVTFYYDCCCYSRLAVVVVFFFLFSRTKFRSYFVRSYVFTWVRISDQSAITLFFFLFCLVLFRKCMRVVAICRMCGLAPNCGNDAANSATSYIIIWNEKHIDGGQPNKIIFGAWELKYWALVCM